MNIDELKEFFYEKVGQYEHFSNDVLKYINGEIDEFKCALSQSRKYYNINSLKEIRKELDGENRETARRMMYVICKIQQKYLCRWYDKPEKNAAFLIDIGYSFEEILNETLLKDIRFIRIIEGYKIAELLYDNFKEDVEKFAENIMTSDLSNFKNIAAVFKGDGTLEFYVQLICICILLDKDEEKYKVYKDILSDYFSDASLNGELTVILYRCHKHDKRLFNILKDNILQKSEVSKYLINYCFEQNNKYLNFLKENNIETYPYYSFAAYDCGFSDRSKILKDLFKKDKDTFYKTYEFLKTIPKESYRSLYMLGIMLNNNEGNDILNDVKENFLDYLKVFRRGKSETHSLFFLVNNYKNKAEELFIKLINSSNEYNIQFRYGYDFIEINVISVLYDYDEQCKNFIDFLLYMCKKYKAVRELCVITDNYLTARNEWLDAEIENELDILFDKFLDAKDIFRFLCFGKNQYYDYTSISNHELISRYTKLYPKEAVEFLDDDFIKGSIDMTLAWLEHIYYYAHVNDYNPILKFLNHKSKKIRDFCEKYICENEDIFRNKLQEIIPDLKKDSLKLVKRIIKSWDNEHKYGKDFKFDNNESVIEFVNENYDTDNEKLTKWIDESCFKNVRFKDCNDIVPSKAIRFILNEYMALSQVYRIKSCDKIIEMFNIEDFRGVLSNIFNLWIDLGSEAKKKNIAIPYCIYSSDSTILNMKKQLETWAKASRGAVAAYIVNAIALNEGKTALMMIESISNKFPNAMVKKAAKNAIKYAAKVLEVSEDVLCDKIVPSFDFDEYGEKLIDYGTRTFKITLMEDFTLSIFDNEKNKIIKNLPKPNDKDDKFKAESAKKEFNALKKQIKAVVKTQKERLEQVFMNGRTWTSDSWKELFIENPIMQMFARKMIWGVYNENRLIGTFRYMEDGSFNTADEEEYKIPEGIQISLVHPCEMNPEEIKKWKEQLEDYEIVQPFAQINIQPAELKEDDFNGNIINKYSKCTAIAGTLIKTFDKYNFQRGSIEDGGGYNCYYYIDKYLNVGVQINFQDLYVGYSDFDEEIDLGDVTFYRLNEEFNGELIDENLIEDPRKLPERFVLSMISIFDSVVLSKY